MSKVRVYEVAKQLNLDPKAVVVLFQSIGVSDVRNHMSSVEPEQVERVKRHLEKQRTHDVVEERIAPTVLKRRAVAKPSQEPPPAPAAPVTAPPAVVTPMTDVASRRDLSALVGDRPAPRTDDVMAKERDSAQILGFREPEVEKAPKSRPSLRDLPEERKSSRTLAEPERAPEDRPSSRVAPVAPPSSATPLQEVREERASARRLEAVEPVPEVVVAPPTPPTPPTPVPPRAPEPVRPEPRTTSAPKTGIEVWGGRPGVPMPTPANAMRTGIGGGATGAMPRRTQFDPRQGNTGPGARGPMRPGSGPSRPMMGGRGGMMGRNRPVGPSKKPAVSTLEMGAHKKVIRIEDNITLSSMAQKMSLKATELLMKLLGLGMTGVHINTALDADTAKILANEFGWEVEDVAVSEEASIAAARGEETTEAKDAEVDPNLVLRPPVVTVMGHVDHGKTSLLDKIRKANVAAGEAGGITQHIGAYKVQTPGGMFVFLDTPGHEAFTQMRARGASVTDVVILVVAADDGVMPQTKEAVSHAKAAKVPILVAVNKCDKQGADPERVRRELVELGLQPEDWGGDTIFVNVSALTGEGIAHLLEMVALQAEVLDLKANPKKPASGTVLEALLDRGRGPVARILVQEGTLRVGDFVLAGAGFGKVRAMTNEHGKQVHEAPPATPVEILGLSDVPAAGDAVHAVKDPKKAQEIAESRKGKQKRELIPADQRYSLEELVGRLKDSETLELRVIIKGDVQGSVEAVGTALTRLSTERVRLSVVHAGVGAITEGDINLAIASKAIVVGFNVRPAGKASSLAEENGVEIRLYSIIYNAVDDVRSAMEGLLPATMVEKSLGKAEVRMVFKIRNVAVAGSYVTEGLVRRGGHARLLRDGAMIWEGKMAALKRFKDDVKEVAEGFECGISLDGFHDLKEKDIVESYEIEAIKQKL